MTSEMNETLRELEALRQALVKKLTITLIVLIVLFSGVALSFQSPFAIIGGLIFSFFIFGLLQKGSASGYVAEFKSRIIGSLVKSINTDLNYHPKRSISEREFEHAGLFQRPDRFKGEDLVEGQIEKTSLRFSEVHAEDRRTSTNSKGHTTTKYVTIFRGLFFQIDFHKNFSHETRIFPDIAENLFGKFGQALQKMGDIFKKGELVKLENVHFEKEFAVYSTNQIEARYILSPSMMERLLSYKNRSRGRIWVAFHDSQMSLAMEVNKNLFEPPIWSSLLKTDLISEYQNDLEFATDIVEELNLNTRIWTKE
jgi:hypothetical protein